MSVISIKLSIPVKVESWPEELEESEVVPMDVYVSSTGLEILFEFLRENLPEEAYFSMTAFYENGTKRELCGDAEIEGVTL